MHPCNINALRGWYLEPPQLVSNSTNQNGAIPASQECKRYHGNGDDVSWLLDCCFLWLSKKVCVCVLVHAGLHVCVCVKAELFDH